MELLPLPAFRPLVDSDRPRLTAFSCSTGAWYEDEVETFIRDNLWEWPETHAPYGFRVLLALDGDEIAALGAHEEEDLLAGGKPVIGSHVVVVAVALAYQRRKVKVPESEDPVSFGTVMLSALLEDIATSDRASVVTATIATENSRSLRLFDRAGLATERPDPRDDRYVTRIGVF